MVATTRFPHDAARRYAAEPDFAEWGPRLRIHGLDLRHSPSVEIPCSQLGRELPRLDLLVNNASQTVRRLSGLYAHLGPLTNGGRRSAGAPAPGTDNDDQSASRTSAG